MGSGGVCHFGTACIDALNKKLFHFSFSFLKFGLIHCFLVLLVMYFGGSWDLKGHTEPDTGTPLHQLPLSSGKSFTLWLFQL